MIHHDTGYGLAGGIGGSVTALVAYIGWGNVLDAALAAVIGGFLGALMKGAGHWTWLRIKARLERKKNGTS